MKFKSLIVPSLAAGASVAILASCKPAAPAATSTPTPAPSATAAPAPSQAASTPAASPAAAAASPEAAPASPAASSAPAAENSAIADLKDPVAVVNGEPITKADLDEAFANAIKAAGVKVGDLTPEQKLEGYRQLLNELIMDKLISKASGGVTVSQADVDAEIKKIKGQFPSEEEFNKQLEAAGQSPDKLNDSLKKMLQQQKWLEGQIADEVAVSEDDAKKFYDANKAEFAQPPMVKASHILFRVNKDDSEEVSKQKLEAAKKAEARAKKGEDFAKLAAELSEEPGAKESGGDLDYFTKDRMVPEFADVAFKEKVGDISDPVKTEFGWHIIKVTGKKDAHTMTFEEVKPQLIAYLKKQKQDQAMQKLLKSLRDSAKVENNLPPPAPESAAPAEGMAPIPADSLPPTDATSPAAPAATPVQ